MAESSFQKRFIGIVKYNQNFDCFVFNFGPYAKYEEDDPDEDDQHKGPQVGVLQVLVHSFFILLVHTRS